MNEATRILQTRAPPSDARSVANYSNRPRNYTARSVNRLVDEGTDAAWSDPGIRKPGTDETDRRRGDWRSSRCPSASTGRGHTHTVPLACHRRRDLLPQYGPRRIRRDSARLDVFSLVAICWRRISPMPPAELSLLVVIRESALRRSTILPSLSALRQLLAVLTLLKY